MSVLYEIFSSMRVLSFLSSKGEGGGSHMLYIKCFIGFYVLSFEFYFTSACSEEAAGVPGAYHMYFLKVAVPSLKISIDFIDSPNVSRTVSQTL